MRLIHKEAFMYISKDNCNFDSASVRYFSLDEEVDEVGEFEMDVNYVIPALFSIVDSEEEFGGDFREQQAPPPFLGNPISQAPFDSQNPQGVQGPMSKPPNFIPSKNDKKAVSLTSSAQTKAVDPGSMKPCIRKFVYIWQKNDYSYWSYLTYVGPKSIAGWRWSGWRWVYFGLDLNRIDSFICY